MATPRASPQARFSIPSEIGAFMIYSASAFARAGLVGNPSDGYFGKTLSFVVRNFKATVRLWESPNFEIVPDPWRSV